MIKARKKFRIPRAAVGTLLAFIVVLCVASRYEDLSVGWLRVNRIYGNPRETNTTITVKAPITFELLATMSGNQTISGKQTVVGVADVGALDMTQSAATSATNGATVTLTSGVTKIFSTGGGNLTTNTITLTRPTSAGLRIIYNDATSSNLIAIASSGSWNGAALELAAGEAAIAVGLESVDGVGTNAWDGQEL